MQEHQAPWTIDGICRSHLRLKLAVSMGCSSSKAPPLARCFGGFVWRPGVVRCKVYHLNPGLYSFTLPVLFLVLVFFFFFEGLTSITLHGFKFEAVGRRPTAQHIGSVTLSFLRRAPRKCDSSSASELLIILQHCGILWDRTLWNTV